MPTLSHQTRCRREGHLLAQHQHQCLEQQREAGQLARPRRLDQAHRAVGQLHPRGANLEEAFMLEEVQMSVTLSHRVVHGVLAVHARYRKATARGKVHPNRERARLRIEIRAGHVPRGTDTQRRLKQFLSHPRPLALRQR